MLLQSYLKQLKMDNFSNRWTQHCVCPIFSTVAHRVKSSIPSPDTFFCHLCTFDHPTASWFPKGHHSRENVSPLVHKKCVGSIRTKMHVREYHQNFSDTRIAKLSNKFPAGYRPNTKGWLHHLNGVFPASLQLLQCCTTVTIVPFLLTSISGFSYLQLKQNMENKVTKQVRKTINLGSSWTGVSGSTLKKLKDSN